MPIPTPTSGESEDDFISRCMSEAVEFEDEDQRLAVCFDKLQEERSAKAAHEYVESLGALRAKLEDTNGLA